MRFTQFIAEGPGHDLARAAQQKTLHKRIAELQARVSTSGPAVKQNLRAQIDTLRNQLERLQESLSPEYQVGKSPMTEGPQTLGSVITGKSNYGTWTPNKKTKKKTVKEGEPTQSSGSLFGGPTGSIGEADITKTSKTYFGVTQEAGVAPVYEDDDKRFDAQRRRVKNGITQYLVYNAKGEPVWCTVPTRPQDEDTDGIVSEALEPTFESDTTRKDFFKSLMQRHPNLPARYRDMRDAFTAESQDKNTLHTIAMFAHQNGLQTTLKQSTYEWDRTWILNIRGFAK